MSATRFNDAVLALVAAYKAAPAFAQVPVYDTVQPVSYSDADFIVVGHDGSLASDGQLSPNPVGGSWTQSDVAEGLREETGYVSCVIIAQSGLVDPAARRQRASDLMQAAEDAAAANGGLTGTGIMFAGTSDGRWIPWLSQGAAAIFAYRVYYSTGWN